MISPPILTNRPNFSSTAHHKIPQSFTSILPNLFPFQTTTATLKIRQSFSKLVDNRWHLQSALAGNYKLSRLTLTNVNGRAFQGCTVVENNRKKVFSEGLVCEILKSCFVVKKYDFSCIFTENNIHVDRSGNLSMILCHIFFFIFQVFYWNLFHLRCFSLGTIYMLTEDFSPYLNINNEASLCEAFSLPVISFCF